MEKLIEIYNQVNQFGRDNNFELEIINSGEINYKMTVQAKHLATPTAAHGGVRGQGAGEAAGWAQRRGCLLSLSFGRVGI